MPSGRHRAFLHLPHMHRQLFPNLFCKFRIKIFQDFCPQSKRRRKLTGSACHSSCSVHKLTTLLRFSRTEIYGTPQSRTISIVHFISSRRTKRGMVAVVRYLIIEFALSGFILSSQSKPHFISSTISGIPLAPLFPLAS